MGVEKDLTEKGASDLETKHLMKSFAPSPWWAVAVLISVLGHPPSARGALDAQVVTVGGEVRERYEFRDNADFNSNVNDTLSLIGSRIRLHLNYEVTSDIAAFIQIRTLGCLAARFRLRPTTISSICTKGT